MGEMFVDLIVIISFLMYEYAKDKLKHQPFYIEEMEVILRCQTDTPTYFRVLPKHKTKT